MGKAQAGQPSYAKVFVYGTLKEGHRLHHILRLAGGRLVSRAAGINHAAMFDLGYFPGVVLDGDQDGEYNFLDTIDGELWEVVDLKVLDHLEGHPSFYRREKRKVWYFANGNSNDLQDTQAWVYALPAHPYAERCVRLKPGRWVDDYESPTTA